MYPATRAYPVNGVVDDASSTSGRGQVLEVGTGLTQVEGTDKNGKEHLKMDRGGERGRKGGRGGRGEREGGEGEG